MNENQIVIYKTNDGKTAIDVRMENETVWLTQAQMAMLFQKDQSVVARHIANVFNWLLLKNPFRSKPSSSP